MSEGKLDITSQYALISTYDKTNVVPFAEFLVSRGYKILSTGGTFKILAEKIKKSELFAVSELTKFPEILDGRVKTLHPKIYGSLLAKRSKRFHREQLKEHGIPDIRIVAVNLYPFHQAVEENMDMEEAQELIDIGGVSLIRGSAKNWQDVLILTDPKDYQELMNNYDSLMGNDTFRLSLAVKAYQTTSNYDYSIATYIDPQEADTEVTDRQYKSRMKLKYGCNPHQGEARISTIFNQTDISKNRFPLDILSGSPGYINLLDALNGWQLVRELRSLFKAPAAASFKHTSPAGSAIATPLDETLKKVYDLPNDLELTPLATAFIRARNADPMSSFGDFIALSDICDEATARLIKREISDGVIAPDYTEEALDLLRSKKNGNYLILRMDPEYEPSDNLEYREIFGLGFTQERNTAIVGQEVFANPKENMPTTNKDVPAEAKRDLLLATTTLKYSQSNNVVFAKGGQVVGVAAGQQSRVDCVKLGGRKVTVWYLRQHPKAKALWEQFRKDIRIKRQDKVNAIVRYVEGDFTEVELKTWNTLFVEPPAPLTQVEKDEFMRTLNGVSMSSDAFFPFRDNIDHASKFGVSYVMQPGGSLADAAVAKACDDYNMVMVNTGKRMFTH